METFLHILEMDIASASFHQGGSSLQLKKSVTVLYYSSLKIMVTK